MIVKQLVRHALGPLVGPVRALRDKIEFEVQIRRARRTLADGGRAWTCVPTGTDGARAPGTVRVGFFGHDARAFVEVMRQQGFEAELVVEDGDARGGEPAYVRRVVFDARMQARFEQRRSAVPEVQALYREAFGAWPPDDLALLLAQQMGHWPALLAMKRYDVVQLAGPLADLGFFCPRPHVLCPRDEDPSGKERPR